METRHDVLFNQLETYRNETLELVNGLTEKQANITPKGFNNNIRWNLGHIYLDQYLWIQALTKEKIDVTKLYNVWFGFGTSPQNFDDQTPKLDELKSLLVEQPTIIRRDYGSCLDKSYEPIDMGMYTIEHVLVRTIYHEGLHASAIQLIKRFI